LGLVPKYGPEWLPHTNTTRNTMTNPFDDEIFAGDPREKFYDIVFTANRNIVSNEIDKIIDRANALEALLEEHLGEEHLGEGHDIEKMIKSHQYSNLQNIENQKINSYIVHTADIVTCCE
jgi:hypothetical protein